MIGRRAAVVLSLLCALVSCAIAAPSAVAIKGTTVFICKEEPLADGKTVGYEDEHCTKKQVGEKAKWIEEAIPPNNKVGVAAVNHETGENWITAGMSTVIGGITFSAQAEGFKTCFAGSSVENKEVLGRMETVGKFCGEFYKVEVLKPTGCLIKEARIELNANAEARTVVKEAGKSEEMYVEFLPPTGKPFTTFTIEGPECALKGKKVEVTGSVKANVSFEPERIDGPTLRFQNTNTLKVGGVAASFDGMFTVSKEVGVGKLGDPIALATSNN